MYFKHSVIMIFDALKMQREVLNAENNQRVMNNPLRAIFFFQKQCFLHCLIFFLKQFCLLLLIEIKDVFRKSKYHNGIHSARSQEDYNHKIKEHYCMQSMLLNWINLTKIVFITNFNLRFNLNAVYHLKFSTRR